MKLKSARAAVLQKRLYRRVFNIHRITEWYENTSRGLAILGHFHLQKEIQMMRGNWEKQKQTTTKQTTTITTKQKLGRSKIFL